LLSFYPIMNMR